ncbi:hypothetical protein ABQF34_11030 [Mycolicibacterium boenickei]
MNVDEQHDLSATSAEVLTGWAVLSGEGAGTAFLGYIELNWPANRHRIAPSGGGKADRGEALS